MARRCKNEPISVLTEEQKRDRINRGFYEIRRLLLKVGELRAEHIKPLQDAITKEWRSVKAETGTDRADLDPFFRLFMRDRLAEESDDAADAERIKANLKRVYQALAVGETIDFLGVLDMPEEEATEDESGDGFEEDVTAAEERIAEDSEDAGETQAGEPPAAGVDSPDADWGDDHLSQTDGEDGSNSGFAFHAGEAAAENGTSFRDLLRNYGKSHRSAWAKSAKAGFDAKTKQMERAKDADTGAVPDVAPLNVVEMVPLPKITDGVAASSGDAA